MLWLCWECKIYIGKCGSLICVCGWCGGWIVGSWVFLWWWWCSCWRSRVGLGMNLWLFYWFVLCGGCIGLWILYMYCIFFCCICVWCCGREFGCEDMWGVWVMGLFLEGLCVCYLMWKWVVGLLWWWVLLLLLSFGSCSFSNLLLSCVCRYLFVFKIWILYYNF